MRGQGLAYSGTHEQYHGAVVVDMVDCDCAECYLLEPFDMARRVEVVADKGPMRLVFTHTRCASWVDAPWGAL